MPLLSRTEEMILLAVWKLGENAYGVTIAEMLSHTTGKEWLLGAIYVPLERLENKGYLASDLGNPTNIRGGRRKRLYGLTKTGLKSLIATKNMEQSLWQNISLGKLEEDYEAQ